MIIIILILILGGLFYFVSIEPVMIGLCIGYMLFVGVGKFVITYSLWVCTHEDIIVFFRIQHIINRAFIYYTNRARGNPRMGVSVIRRRVG